jgi:hypothetical protein
VTIVARGDLSPDEIAGACRQLADEHVSHFAKLVDTAASTSGVNQEQMAQIVESLRGRSPEAERGPVAFLIDPDRPRFASLHQARDWLLKTQRAGWQAAPQPGSGDEAAVRTASELLSDPRREATLYRRGQRRAVRVSRSRPSYAVA